MAKRPGKKTLKMKKAEKKRLAEELNKMVLPKPARVGVTIVRGD